MCTGSDVVSMPWQQILLRFTIMIPYKLIIVARVLARTPLTIGRYETPSLHIAIEMLSGNPG